MRLSMKNLNITGVHWKIKIDFVGGGGDFWWLGQFADLGREVCQKKRVVVFMKGVKKSAKHDESFLLILPLNLDNFRGLYLSCGCIVWLLVSQHKWLYITSYPCPWMKNLSANTTKYILKCWERSVKRKPNLSFIRVIKNSFFINAFLYG